MTDPKSPDQEVLEKNLTKINDLTQRMVAAMSERKAHSPALESPDYHFYAKAAAAYFAEMMSDPSRIIEAQVGYWTQSLKNWSEIQQQIAAGESDVTPEPVTDKRFKN
jgi:polyhydroxyalkanoate synthase